MSKKNKKKDKKGGDAWEKAVEDMEAIEDTDLIPKHAVMFKLRFEIKHLAIEDYKILLKFIDPENPDEGYI